MVYGYSISFHSAILLNSNISFDSEYFKYQPISTINCVGFVPSQVIWFHKISYKNPIAQMDVSMPTCGQENSSFITCAFVWCNIIFDFWLFSSGFKSVCGTFAWRNWTTFPRLVRASSMFSNLSIFNRFCTDAFRIQPPAQLMTSLWRQPLTLVTVKCAGFVRKGIQFWWQFAYFNAYCLRQYSWAKLCHLEES